MATKRILTMFVALAFMVVAFVPAAAYEVTAGRNIVEPGRSMQKTGLPDTEMHFTRDELAAQLYGDDAGSLKSVIISELPEPEKGLLRLGKQELALYSSISADDIGELRFIPATGFEGNTFFCMRGVDTAGNYTKTHMVSITLTALKTAPPEASDAAFKTLKNFSLSDALPANTDESAIIEYIVTREPKLGTLTVSGDGRFVYIPGENATGDDEFTFRVADVYGNQSVDATVKISIGKPQSDLYYEDMAGSFAHVAAIQLADMGVLRGEQLSGKNFFYPTREVSRGEFLVMLMKCADIEAEVPVSVINTGMSDDGAIPQWMKGYVSAAVQTGIVAGSGKGDGFVSFDADMPITRAQAAVMISNALALTPRDDKAHAFTDMQDIPAWAVDALSNMRQCGIMRGYADGSSGAMNVLTRAEAATLLQRMTAYQESQREPEAGFNFFSWLFGG